MTSTRMPVPSCSKGSPRRRPSASRSCEFDKALHGTSQALVADRFVVIKIDVGNFDKNLDIAKRYGNPIGKGIPAVVVLSASNALLYSTKAGELANARRLGETGIYDFLARNLGTP